ncbi:VOC family protein [Leptolyngbya sp. FACHB-261]|nr:VOC family protein [Leptolyngbya sp. FACHB-261]MBD2102363.1 VOC family protein [Leptolyngbya sp. FACHB-261]
MHHMSVRTADIFQAIRFYELLGFEVQERFTTGMTLACWLAGPGGRLELIQIPEPKPAPDAFGDEHYVGYYHLSFQVENLNQLLTGLKEQWPLQLQVLLEPTEQLIGEQQYRVAFIADPDGLPIEFLQPL